MEHEPGVPSFGSHCPTDWILTKMIHRIILNVRSSTELLPHALKPLHNVLINKQVVDLSFGFLLEY